MGVMEKMRKSTGVILWLLIFSFGILWVLADTRFFDALQAGPRSLGSVNGDAISIEEYNSRISYYIDQYSKQTGNSITPELRAYYEDQAWNELVTSKLLQQKMDELGISVTDQEVVHMITGENPDPFIRQQFQKKDGTIDRVALQAAIDAPENSQVWISIEQQLRQKKRQQKMSNYVQSALAVSSYEVEQAYIHNNTVADVSFVRFPYADIPDSAISVSDSDLRNYYDNHQDQYKRKESYRFQYVGFDKTPTREDTTRTLGELNNLRKDFTDTQNDSLFLVRYQSVTPYKVQFVNKDDVRDEYKPVLDLEKGEVSNVLQHNGQAFVIKKLDETRNQVKFAVLTFDIKADPVSTIDKRAEEADDFSFFAEENGYESEVKRRKLKLKEAFATKENPFIAGLGQSRQILNFLKSADEGDISKPLELSGQFVVLRVTEVTPDGIRPFDEIKSQIRTIVTNKKREEQMLANVKDLLASNATLDELASAGGKKVSTVNNLSMNAAVLEGAGREPKVIGAVFGLNEGDQSTPVKGTNAVFVVKVNKRQNVDLKNLDNATRQQIRTRLKQQKSASFGQVWLDQLKDNADIEDHRTELLQPQ